MLLIYHYLATTILIVLVFGFMVALGYQMPLRYVLLLVLGMYFFGVGVDVDHINGHGYSKMVECGMYLEESPEYHANCGGLRRKEMHTMAVPIALVMFAAAWVLHMLMDGKW